MTAATLLSVRKEKLAEEPSPPAGVKRVLVVDIGGNNVKALVTGQIQPRKFSSGPFLTPEEMIAGIQGLVADWDHNVVSIGYPGPVLDGRPLREPVNLGQGWVRFDFEAAFRRPVEIINDAAMQAMGSYRSGRMLFLGLGTGLGTTLVIEGVVHPMELGHLPYKKGTFEDYVGLRGLERHGKKQWRADVATWSGGWSTPSNPPILCLAGETSKNSKSCRRMRGSAITPTPSREAFGCGRLDGPPLRKAWPSTNAGRKRRFERRSANVVHRHDAIAERGIGGRRDRDRVVVKRPVVEEVACGRPVDADARLLLGLRTPFRRRNNAEDFALRDASLQGAVAKHLGENAVRDWREVPADPVDNCGPLFDGRAREGVKRKFGVA